jgi:hypothetical protein
MASVDKDRPAFCFSRVLADELQEIHKLRLKREQAEEKAAPRAGDAVESKVSAEEPKKEGQGEKEPRTNCIPPKDAIHKAHDMKLVGLAFSGGGIRSATFNLGILQGLADRNLLGKFDYLSTVSGGGYIGSWLEGWIFRTGHQEKQRAPREDQNGQEPSPKREYTTAGGIKVVEKNLKSARLSREPGQEDRTEPQPIRFLREYSNYLTPRNRLLSADTWTMVAIYLRNLLLNQTVLTLFLFALLLLPYIAGWITGRVQGLKSTHLEYVAPAAVLLALCFGMVNLRGLLDGDRTSGRKAPWFQKQHWILTFIVVPIFLAAWILTAWLWSHPPYWNCQVDARLLEYWAAGGFVALGVPWILSSAIGTFLWKPYGRLFWWEASALVTGAVAGLVMFFVFHEIVASIDGGGELWNELSAGVPLTLLVFLIVASIQIGIMGTTFPDPYREWLARVAGLIFIFTIAWAAAFAFTIYAPLGLMWLRGLLLAAGGITWVASTAAGVLGANSSKTGDLESRTVQDALLSVTPYIFIAGLLSLFSLALELILASVNSKRLPAGAWDQFLAESPAVAKVASWVFGLTTTKTSSTLIVRGLAVSHTLTQRNPAFVAAHWKILEAVTNYDLLPVFAIVSIACVCLAWRVDLNEFSMNLFYRNRLVRCYLGATHVHRRPNPFTGFDGGDDLFLRELRDEYCYSGPFPIFNATLNLVSTRDLAWQERKAESFSMTPLSCGFDTWLEEVNLERDYPQSNELKLARYAYRPTENYAYSDGGFYVGTAVSISGAAMSPNMGYHSQPSLAMLMTFFNVRLGFWAGNPRHKTTWVLPGPIFGLWRLLGELLGLTDDNSRYVYLSDGGHFENLGIYELVKRRCKYIIACDAAADPDYALEDLGNAVRKCREDIGVEINLVSSVVVPAEGKKRSAWHFVVGEILYDMVDPKRNSKVHQKDEKAHPRQENAEQINGIFVYVKASLTGDEPPDVLNYQTAHTDFPHQTTADQWFTESQFESYRRLGQHIVETMFYGAETHVSTETLFKSLEKHWGTKVAMEFLNKEGVGQKDKESAV